MLSVNPMLEPDEIRDILHKTAYKKYGYTYDSAGWNNEVGYGILHSRYAIADALAPLLEIIGSDSICGTEIYHVSPLPNEVYVQWSFLDANSSNSNLLQINYPNYNECIINIENNENLSETLVATVSFMGHTIKTLYKNISTNWNLSGTYSVIGSTPLNNNVINAPFANNKTINVYPGYDVTLCSENFANVNLSHTPSSQISWNYDGYETINLHVSPLANNMHTMSITGLGNSDCDNFKIRLRVLRVLDLDPLLKILSSGSISIIPNEEKYEYSKESGQDWIIEIINATTGKVVYKGIITDMTKNISTYDWDPGLYTIRHVIGNESLIQKFLIK